MNMPVRNICVLSKVPTETRCKYFQNNVSQGKLKALLSLWKEISANEPGSMLSGRAILTLSGIACSKVKHTVTCQLC